MTRAILFLFAMAVAAPAPLNPQPISQFDGRSWSGITLGVTTDDDLKKTFGVNKNPIRPEAVYVKTVADAPMRLDALLDGRGGKAKVTALRLEYPGRAPSVVELETSLQEKSVAFYAVDRYEDWSVRVFPSRGIAAFVMGEKEFMRTSLILLMQPTRLGDLVNSLRREQPTPVTAYNPRFTDDDLLVTYGDISVSLTSSSVDFQRKRDVEDDIEDELRRRSRARFMDYSSRGAATMNASVSVRWDERRQTYTIDATVSLAGRNALGNVSASGNQSEKWTRIANKPRITSSRDILNVVDDARTELERNFDDAVLRQRPPTKEQIRAAQWAALINGATQSL